MRGSQGVNKIYLQDKESKYIFAPELKKHTSFKQCEAGAKAHFISETRI